MTEVKTESGLIINVNQDAFDDMELVDDLAAVDQGEAFAVSRVLNKLFEPEEKKKLYDFCRENGKVKIEKTTKTLVEIFKALGEEGKNS